MPLHYVLCYDKLPCKQGHFLHSHKTTHLFYRQNIS